MASSKQRIELNKLKQELNKLYKETYDFIEENKFNIEMHEQTTFSSKLVLRAKRVTRSFFSLFIKNI
jgi:hypothetical protein